MEILAATKTLLWLGLGGAAIYGANEVARSRHKLATATLGKGIAKGNDGFILSKKHQIPQKITLEHIIIIAPTGAGKSTSQFIPNLLENNLQGSLVIADPKGELYKLTHKYQESIGRKTILYRPLQNGMQYNPVEECKTVRDFMQLSQNILINGALSYEIQTGKKSNDITWIQMSQPLVTAALMYSKSIPSALKLLINNDDEELDFLFGQCKNNVITEQYNAFKVSLKNEKGMSSIKMTIAGNLQLFLDNLSINKSDFNAETLRKQPTALYISYPENKSAYLSPLTACIYSQLVDKLIDSYTDESFPIWFLTDEFANQGQWSNMSQNISTARSRKVGFILCLQSISQLKQIYGHDNALSILNNCKTKIILPGLSDIETLKYVSELCGEEEITISENGKNHKTKKLLFTSDEVRRIGDKKLLIISNNLRPILTDQNIYYENSKYLERCK